MPGYGDLTAVVEGRVKEVDPELFLMAPGPRIVDAVEAMLALLEESFQ